VNGKRIAEKSIRSEFVKLGAFANWYLREEGVICLYKQSDSVKYE
jgi:hypothetical protein